MPAELEHQIVLILTDVLQTIGWGGVAFIMALESANIPIPSEVTMPLAGWLLVQAQGGSLFASLLARGIFWCTRLHDRFNRFLRIGSLRWAAIS